VLPEPAGPCDEGSPPTSPSGKAALPDLRKVFKRALKKTGQLKEARIKLAKVITTNLDGLGIATQEALLVSHAAGQRHAHAAAQQHACAAVS
jgi:hypothetical protein